MSDWMRFEALKSYVAELKAALEAAGLPVPVFNDPAIVPDVVVAPVMPEVGVSS